MKKITIVLVDDHTLVRKGIRSVIMSNELFEIVAEASSGEEAIKEIVDHEPDVLISDISMHGISGLALCEMISERELRTNILILSMHKDPEYVIKAFEAGAKGYLPKDSSDQDLFEAITTVSSGGRFMTGFVNEILATSFVQGVGAVDTENLTLREKEILSKIVSGLSNKQIAFDLFISTRTVDTHRTNIMRKLKASNAAELVRIALTKKII